MDSSKIEIIQKKDYKVLVRIIHNFEEWEHEYTQENTFNDLINDYTNGTTNEFPNEIIDYLSNRKSQEFSNERLIKDYTTNYEEENVVLSHSDLTIPEIIGKPFSDPFCIFTFIKKEKILKMLKFNDRELYGLNDYGPYTAYCNGDNKLYISGGEKGKKYIEKFWKIDLKTLEIECFDMIPKKNHSMIVIPGNYVFIVGGQDTQTFYYDLENSQFLGWKPLKRNRTEPALIFINNYLYCFDNIYSKKYENEFTFEKTNLNSDNHEWELIKPIMDKPDMKMNQKFFGVVKKDDDILFIGGNLDYDENSEKDGAIIPKNYKCNIVYNKVEESEIPFTEYNLKEKTFLPYNENIYYIFPDFNKNHPEVIFYRKDKNKVQLVKYESQEELEENPNTHKKIKDLPPAKINRLNFNQPKLDENINNLDLNVNPINTDNDNNKNPEIKKEENVIENNNNNINNIINNNKEDNFNNENMNENLNENEHDINNMKEQNIKISIDNPEKNETMKGKYNIFSNTNIFLEEGEGKQVIIGSTNEYNINLVNDNNNNNINENLGGAQINLNINQDNNQDINIGTNNFEGLKNSFNNGIDEEKKIEEEPNEEISKSKSYTNNTPTENLQILEDMIKSSKNGEKKENENQQNILDTPQIIQNDNNINIDINIPDINNQQLDINLENSKKKDSQKDININLEKQNNESKGEIQKENDENVAKKEKEEFFISGIIKGTKKTKKEKEKEKESKERKKENEENKSINNKESTDFFLKGMILGKKETDKNIIKYYNEKYKPLEEKDKKLNEIGNEENKFIENPFKLNNIEIKENINSNPSNIEINKNTEDINNLNSKIGTDIKTPNQLTGNIHENNIQPFDINIQNPNLEIKANVDNKEINADTDFNLTGIIKGTRYLNIKKEIKNESDINHNAPKLDINGNIVGVEVNTSKIEIEKKEPSIEGDINLNGQKIISIENKDEENPKENENNKKETKEFFCLKGMIVSEKNKNKNKNKTNESEKNNLEGKIEIGGIGSIKGENENMINININNDNIKSENIAINGQNIDNE